MSKEAVRAAGEVTPESAPELNWHRFITAHGHRVDLLKITTDDTGIVVARIDEVSHQILTRGDPLQLVERVCHLIEAHEDMRAAEGRIVELRRKGLRAANA